MQQNRQVREAKSESVQGKVAITDGRQACNTNGQVGDLQLWQIVLLHQHLIHSSTLVHCRRQYNQALYLSHNGTLFPELHRTEAV